MATRKRILAALLCAAALALLAVPTAAAKTVYFTAVNENILELKDESMPFWSGQNIYVDSAIFSDRWLGLYCNRNRENGTVVIWETSGQRRALLFELDTGYVTGSDGNNYSPAAIQKNGRVFVPAGVVADYFGLTYNNVRVDHGFLIWIHSADATVSVLTAQEFANAASYQMTARYQRYLQAQEDGAEDGSGGDEPAAITGKTPTHFRPPFGEYDDHVIATVRGMGIEPIQWDVEGLAAVGAKTTPPLVSCRSR